MGPEVTAAIIAAGVGVPTVAATVAVQISGRRATSRDTQKALEEQHKQLDRTLAEQRTRTLNERFATAAGQLGSDKPAVRLAGVYAMAGLPDDWEDNRQTCVDVLCAYLRMPYEADPGNEAPRPEQLAFRAIREVRHTVIRVITAHIQGGAAVSWKGLDFDFTGVVFDGGSFNDAEFSGGTVSFAGAVFSRSTVYFDGAEFSGGTVYFTNAWFDGGGASFTRARFSGGRVLFEARFSGGTVDFSAAGFCGGTVDFSGAGFDSGVVDFSDAGFEGGTVSFTSAWFDGGVVDFTRARFSGSHVYFGNLKLLNGARFSGGTLDFSSPGDWSVPPAFPWADTPPPA